MSYEVKPGNIFGRLGAGIGKGLSEQIPKEVDRYRLANGIQSLEGKQMSPLSQYAELVKSGASPDQIRDVFPFIRNAAIAGQNPMQGNIPKQSSSEDLGQNGQMGQNTKSQAALQSPNQQQPAQSNPSQQQSLKRPEGESAARRTILPPTDAQIEAQTRHLLATEPNIYQGENAYAQARDRAIYQLNEGNRAQAAEIEADSRRQSQENTLNTKFSNKIKDKLISNVPDDVQQRFLKKAEFDVNNGMSTENATEKQTDALKKMNENLVSLNNSIGGRAFFSKAPDQLIKDVARLRPAFAENGELELFKDKQKLALDIGDHLASANTWPGSKKQENIITSGKKLSSDQLAAKLAETIDENTSLFTLGYLINKAGGDDQAVIQHLADLADNGIINLDKRQNREAAEYYTLNENKGLGDFLFKAFAGALEAPIHATYNYVTGRKQKVGPIEKLKQAFGKE